MCKRQKGLILFGKFESATVSGQLMTSCDFGETVIPVVAVPDTEKAKELAERWSKLSQIQTIGIKFALVKEDGSVSLL